MIFQKTILDKVLLIQLTKISDNRGFFARSWCQKEFEQQGLNPNLVQCNISFNQTAGTLRGMHFQAPPYEEAKLVRCTQGAIYDVVIDLRPNSPTYKQWIGVELTADNYKMLYIPEGMAHGFQTLVDRTEVFYQMSEFYVPEAARGVRWNDPAFDIKWPHCDHLIISEKDQNYPEF